MGDRAYVVGAYLPSGAAQMNYALAELLKRTFGLEVIVVTMQGENGSQSPFCRHAAFPTMSAEAAISSIRPNDLLIASPAWAAQHWFGLRLKCKSIMYVQAFDVVPYLDCFFDHYVSVSSYCAQHIRDRYGLDSRVIPPFIDIGSMPAAPPWRERISHDILVSSKRDLALCALLLERIRNRIADSQPNVTFTRLQSPEHRPHRDILARLARSRYLLTLTPSEGFGLIPLEAMALGVTVAGFDGYGGREYMTPENCACRPYPDIEGAIANLTQLLADHEFAEAMSAAGILTAANYSKNVFEESWTNFFRDIL